ncbi:MAG: GNAT family N-acetyltransferase [Oleibacter sp.]|nr:GNAT family N-acetyltransferase [Thalassolituus sp.]
MPQANVQFSDDEDEFRLVTRLTTNKREIRQALELRYRVFAEDMGASVQGADLGIDQDRFDEYCMHLIVKDEISDRVVGYSRILTNELATRAGGYYSATEFDLSNVLKPGKTYMEIGRTCIDLNFRCGAAIGHVWRFLTDYMEEHQIDYLMGCCSIPITDGFGRINAVMDYLSEKHFTPDDQRAIPKIAIPSIKNDIEGKRFVPSLLKAYLRMGVLICGDAYHDRDFGVADALILLKREDLNHRYIERLLRE